jgi:hypothetical protein
MALKPCFRRSEQTGNNVKPGQARHCRVRTCSRFLSARMHRRRGRDRRINRARKNIRTRTAQLPDPGPALRLNRTVRRRGASMRWGCSSRREADELLNPSSRPAPDCLHQPARACWQIHAGVADQLQRSTQARAYCRLITTRGAGSCAKSFSGRPL